MKLTASIAALALLSGCANVPVVNKPLTTVQVQTAIADVQAACGAAEQALTLAQMIAKGGALETVNSVGEYIRASCDTADAVAKLAANPTSVAWLNTLATTISTTAALVPPKSA